MYREDSSNTDIVYRRNLIRHTVMPQLCAYNADAVVHLAGIARHAQAAWEIMTPLLTQWINDNVCMKSDSVFSIRKEALLPDSLCKEALAELFRARNIPFNQKHIERFLTNTQKPCGQFLLCSGWSYRTKGLSVMVEKDYVEQPRYSIDPFYFELAVPGSTQCAVAGVAFVIEYFNSAGLSAIDFDDNNMVVFLDAGTISGTLKYRSIVPEDRFVPLGIADSRNVESFLHKQSLVQPRTFPVGVVTDVTGKILWIPGVRTSNYCRITSKTTSILKISCNLL
jgi:tRNA(Ile)-lysidine synthase